MEGFNNYQMHQNSPGRMASYCRHYAMCKIDFLDVGLCEPGRHHHFVSYYPQGRMDLYAALEEGKIGLTPAALDIADSCNLCGKCDYACHFVTGLRPMEVMKALKHYVAEHRHQVKETTEEDPVFNELRQIVGEDWCSRDPAIGVGYASDPGPATPYTLPSYVVLPSTTEQVAALMRFCRQWDLDFAVRGNGSSVMGFVMNKDIVLDMARMNTVEVDEERALVKAGAGVTAFDLQKKVYPYGYRVQVAEPSAMICANLMCSGIFSTWSHAFGMGSQNVIDAEFVDLRGHVFKLGDRAAPNLFAYNEKDTPISAICTGVEYRMYPRLPDERGFLVPFSNFDDALAFIQEISKRRIGLAAGLLGGEYLGTFLAPSESLGREVKTFFQEELEMPYVVQMISDRYDEDAVRNMGYPVIGQRIFRTLVLSLNQIRDNEVLLHLREMVPGSSVGELLSDKKMEPLLETLLQPDAGKLAAAVPPAMASFYKKLYERPEMTDLVWLNDFRIISARMGREKHVVAWIVYVPLDRPGLVGEIYSEFKRIGDRWNVKNDYGFITPLDFGKRAVFEYDYYVDQQDDEDRMRMLQAMKETGEMIMQYASRYDSVRWIRHTLYQGFARMENLLYT